MWGVCLGSLNAYLERKLLSLCYLATDDMITKADRDWLSLRRRKIGLKSKEFCLFYLDARMSLARSGEDKTVIDLISKSGPRFRHKLKIVLVLLKIKMTTLPAVLRGHKNLFFNCYLIGFARKA